MTQELIDTPLIPEVQNDAVHTPLYHQPAWVDSVGGTTILPIRSADGRVTTPVAVQQERSRALPGHRILRVGRFGHGWPRQTWEPVVERLSSLARSDSKVLRLSIEVFLRSGQQEMRDILRANGFVPTVPRSYRHTLTLPINLPDEVLLAERKSVRKRLREADKVGAHVTVLTEAKYADRIAELQRIAMQRSGGSFRIPDWNAILQLSAEHPELSRVVGLFPAATSTEPGDLLGFVWGCMHGDHAEYRAAGSADMPPAYRHVSISYPLVWNLIRWSREQNATWFDMGGVTLQDGSADPLAGISSVKRFFSEVVEEVGEEWMLEPYPWKSRVAQAISIAAGRLSRLRNSGSTETR